MAFPLLSVAVVGCNIGRAQIAAFQLLPERFRVRAVCDLNLERARQCAAEFGIPLASDDLAELCRRDDLDVISLCTPPAAHFEQIHRVIAAGKQVICEKPLVGSLADLDALAELERSSGLRIMPIFQGRFGHGLQKLRYLISEGLAGSVYLGTVETAWSRGASYYSVPWRTHWSGALGGCLLQQGIHAHDAYSYAVGPVRGVLAMTATRVNDIETEDCAAAAITMADGSLATFAVTLGAAEESTRHRFCFSRMTADSNLSAYRNLSDPWRFVGRTANDQAQIDRALASFIPGREWYAGQFERYAVALAEGDELPVTLQDARASVELVTAFYASVRTERVVVLPLAKEAELYGGWLPVVDRDRPGRSL